MTELQCLNYFDDTMSQVQKPQYTGRRKRGLDRVRVIQEVNHVLPRN